MEYRKLISFGKSSFVVSLPKAWINKQNLKKGDTIYFEEKDNELILNSKETKVEKEEKEIVINISGKDIFQIRREINSAYTLNYKTIILKGEGLKSKIKEIQEAIQSLIALEVMEQTSTSIIAKDFLDMDTISIEELIRKMDLITRTMLTESISTFTEDQYENINNRDKDVNRLFFLIRRIAVYGLNNPTRAFKNFKLDPVDLTAVMFASFYLEGIADEVRRVARYMRLIKISRPQQERFEKIFQNTRDLYLGTMKAFYAKDTTEALRLSNKKKELMTELDPFYQKNSSAEYMPHAVDRLRRLISYVHHLGQLVYQEYNHSKIVKN